MWNFSQFRQHYMKLSAKKNTFCGNSVKSCKQSGKLAEFLRTAVHFTCKCWLWSGPKSGIPNGKMRCTRIKIFQTLKNAAKLITGCKSSLGYSRERASISLLYDQRSRALIWDRFQALGHICCSKYSNPRQRKRIPPSCTPWARNSSLYCLDHLFRRTLAFSIRGRRVLTEAPNRFVFLE